MIGVLEHTLNTFDLTDNPQWVEYLNNIKSVGMDSSDDEIIQWFDKQANPEKICNMCGFEGPKGDSWSSDDRSHILKNYWNYKL